MASQRSSGRTKTPSARARLALATLPASRKRTASKASLSQGGGRSAPQAQEEEELLAEEVSEEESPVEEKVDEEDEVEEVEEEEAPAPEPVIDDVSFRVRWRL